MHAIQDSYRDHACVRKAYDCNQGSVCVRVCVCTQVVCGGDHTLALTSQGRVYSWGGNKWGQLGQCTHDNTCVPRVVGGALEGQRVVQVRRTHTHTQQQQHRVTVGGHEARCVCVCMCVCV